MAVRTGRAEANGFLMCNHLDSLQKIVIGWRFGVRLPQIGTFLTLSIISIARNL